MGHLSHASMVVRGGRTFSRKLLNLVKYLPDSQQKVRLSKWFHPDLLWWSNLLEICNGSAKVIRSVETLDGYIATDSSLSGFGVVWVTDWFVGSWEIGSELNDSIPHNHSLDPPRGFSTYMKYSGIVAGGVSCKKVGTIMEV